MNVLMHRNPRHFLDEFFGDVERAPARNAGGLNIEVKKNDNEYRVVAHMPGVKKEDLSVEIKDGVLTIAGKTERSEKQEHETVYSELSTRTEFSRSLKIDRARFDTEKVQAKIENGVLEVVLPVKPEEQPKQIQIN